MLIQVASLPVGDYVQDGSASVVRHTTRPYWRLRHGHRKLVISVATALTYKSSRPFAFDVFSIATTPPEECLAKTDSLCCDRS